MPLVKLKAIEQATWLRSGGGPERGGVCYYMCNFIESGKGPWDNPGSFVNAVTKAQDFGLGTAMMNYAKSQNLRGAPQAGYAAVAGALTANRIYRGELWVGAANAVPGAANHEIVIVTGNNDDIIYFEPNFGFYQPTQAGNNNRQALEYHINQQYQASGRQAASFAYYNVRSNTSSQPKGFN